ncbi:type III pantothenate kinase [Formivibrio citricus]|uniref:Type III pantothenate kinase n=1 Tax=Formivibrio citricus TaxID=83765 RepID=A0A1I5DPX6_9NEIS|nr:type III pantothenate kinase [Formivibrio citricus]SFO01332.1 type III pantothenate kinase [Formivibrio citricus]
MNLLLDLGNTRIKWAQERDGKLSLTGASNLNGLAQAWQTLPRPDGVMGCSVVSADVQVMVEERARQSWGLPVKWLRPCPEALGVRNHYDASRLGPDRWAAVLGARSLFPGKALVVVSAGTAQVVDVLTAAGDFLGGSIQPGYQLMKAALAGGTARLPLAIGCHVAFPVSTDDAIETGCLNALSGAVEIMRQRLQAVGQREVHVVLTGGDASRIVPLLEGEVSLVDHLPLYGLAALAANGAFQ